MMMMMMMMMMMRMINSSYKSNEFGSFRMWPKHYQNKAIYWRETLKISIWEQNAEIVPSAFLGTFLSRFFCCKFELFWASRRFSLLQTLCARRYEKRTQQAELVGKIILAKGPTIFVYIATDTSSKCQCIQLLLLNVLAGGKGSRRRNQKLIINIVASFFWYTHRWFFQPPSSPFSGENCLGLAQAVRGRREVGWLTYDLNGFP